MKIKILAHLIIITCSYANAQNVGIGIGTPTEKLHVLGNIRSSNVFVDGYLGVNTQSPTYRLHVYDGTLAFTNTTDNITWTNGYSSGSNYFYWNYNGANRFTITNTGNVGIGTSAPASKLEVNGSASFNSAAVDGNLTVNGGDGILRNGNGSGQLKYYTFTGSFGFTNYAGNSVSGPHIVNFPTAAAFTSAPRVMIGNYTSITGTTGHLFSIIPAVYSVTTTGFEVYFFNSSTLPATMNFTMSFICIGAGS